MNWAPAFFTLSRRGLAVFRRRTSRADGCGCWQHGKLGLAAGRDCAGGYPGFWLSHDFWYRPVCLPGECLNGVADSACCGYRRWKNAVRASPKNKEAGFVCLGDPRQTGRMLAVGQLQKPVAPAESCVGMHANCGGAFTHTRALSQLLRVVNPLRHVPESGQRRIGQGVEGRPAGTAAIALQAVGGHPTE